MLTNLRSTKPISAAGASAGVCARRALTLLELIVVVAILAVLAGAITPMLSDTQAHAILGVTRSTLSQVREVVANRYVVDMNELPLPSQSDAARSYAPQLYFLFVNSHTYSTTAPNYVPVTDVNSTTRLGWNGPYLTSNGFTYPNPGDVRPNDALNRTWNSLGFTNSYGLPGDLSVADGWGNPIVVIVDNRTVGSRTRTAAYVVSAGVNSQLETTNYQYSATDGSLLLNADGTVANTDDFALVVRAVWQ